MFEMIEPKMVDVIKLTPTVIGQLPEYSSTTPTGVYPGKLWRSCVKKKREPKAVKVPGLDGYWIAGVYAPKNEKHCTLTGLPFVVLEEDGDWVGMTDICHDVNCYYLSMNQGGIDDVHHSPNCNGALIRRAGKAERQLKELEERFRFSSPAEEQV